MTYPATVHVTTPDKIANWRPLVQWIMAIPHLVVVYVLNIVGFAVAVISWFVIVITGKLPEGLANTQSMVLRYSMRAEIYAGFLYEDYPPFTFDAVSADPGGSPTVVNFSPSLEGRNRLTVALRFIWAIPALIWAMIIGIVGFICWVLAFFAVLFTGKWPAGLRRWVITSIEVSLRANAYALLLTDQYPPFTTE